MKTKFIIKALDGDVYAPYRGNDWSSLYSNAIIFASEEQAVERAKALMRDNAGMPYVQVVTVITNKK